VAEQHEHHADGVAVQTGLRRATAGAQDRPADRGLVVLAHPSSVRALPVPHPVGERVVVGERFALRELVAALQWAPRHHLVVVDRHGAALSTGRPGSLVRRHHGGFPLPPDPDRAALVRRAMVALANLRRTEPLPVVVAAEEGATLHAARHAARANGAGDGGGADPDVLAVVSLDAESDHEQAARRAARALRRAVERQCQRAMASVLVAGVYGRARVGHEEVAAALRDGIDGTLLVADSFGTTADPGSTSAWPATTSPADDAISAALRGGSEVVCVPDDLWVAERGIALVPHGSVTHPSLAGPHLSIGAHRPAPERLRLVGRR
jgi:hypothetical protein